MQAMAKPESDKLQFWYTGRYTGYISNFFLGLLAIAYGIILLNKDDQYWSLNATVFTGVSLFSLMVSGLKWGRIMLSGARVFSHLQTPVRLWQCWQRRILTRTTSALIILFGAVYVLELSHQALFPASALLAMASLALAGGFSLPMVLNQYLPKRCYLLLLAFAAYPAYIFFHAGVRQWIHAPVEWHLPAIFAWPLLVATTLICWKKPPVQKGKALFTRFIESGLISHFRHFRARFTRLGAVKAREKTASLATSDKTMKYPGLFGLLPIGYLLMADWQSPVTLPHLLFLVMFAALSSSAIVVRDLHWRFFLLPDKFQTGRIASHFLISSGVYYGGWALLFFLVVAGSGMFISTQPVWKAMVPSVTGTAILCIELISAFCIGLLIRGSKKPARSCFYLFMASLLASSFASLYLYVHQQSPLKAAIFTMNTTYVLCVIATGFAALIFANNLWTRERLQAYL